LWLTSEPGEEELGQFATGRFQAALLQGRLVGQQSQELACGQGRHQGGFHGDRRFARNAAHQATPADGITTAKTRQSERPGVGIVGDQAHRTFGDEHHLVGETVGLKQGLPGAIAQPLELGPLGLQHALQGNRQGGDVVIRAHGRGIVQVAPGAGGLA